MELHKIKNEKSFSKEPSLDEITDNVIGKKIKKAVKKLNTYLFTQVRWIMILLVLVMV